ncbi:MAG: reprolysin-like metallopeptidase, partial [Bacteroidota bacterium]
IANRISQATTLRTDDLAFDLSIRLPSGQLVEFSAMENDVLPEKLKSDLPNNYSFNLIGKNDPSIRGKIAVGGNNVYGLIYTQQATYTINPSILRDGQTIIFSGLYHPEKPYQPTTESGCGVDPGQTRLNRQKSPVSFGLRSGSGFSFGGQLRTYRLAIGVTGEYYQENGGNDTDVTAAINFAVNGINDIYERELGISFNLAGTPQLNSNAATDPYNTAGFLTVEAAEGINETFSLDDYDIGHVLHYLPGGFSGIAFLGSVCNNGAFFDGHVKAAGWTGVGNNTSLSMIDVFAHEVGHMFSAEHTWNGTGGSCDNTQIGESTSYEIGSGNTIMSYNDICQADNNIANGGASDFYFHAISLTQISDYVSNNGIGADCASLLPSANDIPIVDASPSGLSYSIPINTPFELAGDAIDFHRDDLTYCWEQFDEDGANVRPTQGFIGAIAAANTIAPLFRSYPPSVTPNRTIPALPYILSGLDTGLPFEALPTVARTINFALTVRDNQSDAGAIACDNTSIAVVDNGGSFRISSQNTPTALVANGTNTFAVTWTVNGTDMAPINASQVDILFSIDGGQSFPFTLASSTANDGTETITVPEIETTRGRIKIQPTDNIFFDINNTDITITSSCQTSASFISPAEAIVEQTGAPSLDLNLSANVGDYISSFSGTIDNSDPVGWTAFTDLSDGDCGALLSDYESLTFTISETGTYVITNLLGGLSLAVYNNTYNPFSPCTNILANSYSVEFGVYSELYDALTLDLVAGNTYVLVITNPFGDGDFIIDFQGPGRAYDPQA